MRKKEKMEESNNDIVELEQSFIDKKVSEMPKYVEKQEKKISEEIQKYSEKNLEAVKWDKEGCPIEYAVRVKPMVISNYFLKPITPLLNVEPSYTPEVLGIVYDYYCYIIAEINDKIGDFPPSLTSFCKLAGITLYTLRTLRNSPDLSMRTVVEKIYDQIGDDNITFAQIGTAKERTTLFKLKSQNEMVEKQQPNININITEQPDMERIEARLSKYKQYASKKVGK